MLCVFPLSFPKVDTIEKSVVEVLQNFVNYDFLEMVEAKKKVATNVSECEAHKAKIDVLKSSKKIDQAKIVQVTFEISTRRT
jgi:hypothetical protein